MAGVIEIVAGILVIAICVFLINFVIPKLRYRKFPGPPPSFLYGNYDIIHASRNGTLVHVLLEHTKKYGQAFQFFTMDRRTVVTTNVEDIKQILGSANYPKAESLTETFDRFAGTSLFTIKNEFHQAHRRKISKVFNADFVKQIRKHMKPELQILVRKLGQSAAAGEEIDADHVLVASTADVINRAAFSHLSGVQTSKRSEFYEGLRQGLLDMYSNIFRYPFGLFLPSGRKQIERFKRMVFPYVDKVILQRRSQSAKGDLLDCFMAIPGFTHAQVRSETLTFMTAGHDTTAHSLAWLLLEVSQRPDIERKMVEEIESVLGKYDPAADDDLSSFKMPSYEQVEELQYCRQVWDETLRLHPAGAGGPYRTCDRDGVLRGSGTPVKKGTNLMIPIYVLHRTEEYWPSPNTFDPDRFAPEARKNRNHWTFIPFSAGKRNCIGRFLANFEAMMFVAVLFGRFSFRLNCKYEDVKEFLSVTLRPRTGRPNEKDSWYGIPMTVKCRY